MIDAARLPNEELDQIALIRTRPRLTPIPWSEIHLLPKRKSLIAGLLDSAGMSVVYGGSGSRKTFFVLDIAAHVSLGWDWRGRKIKPGAVVYVAAEGGLGIEERLTAFLQHHGIDAEGVPLYLIPEPIDLCRSEDDTKLLIERLKELPSDPAVVLIVIDTLSRAMAGGNENSPDDMGRFVSRCDALRMATRAHVLVIHHSGKDTDRGARGHSLLKAAADTEIEVTKDDTTGIGTATVAKQRDYETGEIFAFKLEPVEIGQTEDGQPISSCVVVEADAPAKNASPVRLKPNQRTMFSILHDAGPGGLTQEAWNELARDAGIGVRRRAELHDIRTALKAKGLVYEHANGWAVRHEG